MGCLGRIGSLVVLLAAGVVAWMTRDMWMERVTGARPAAAINWETGSPEMEKAARRRLETFAQPAGPAWVNLTGAEAASLILGEGSSRFPDALADVEGAVVGRQLQLRATVDLSSARGLEKLGPVADLLSSRRRVTLSGSPAVPGAGVGAFTVESVRIGEVYIPPPAIVLFLDQLLRERGPAGGGNAAITFPLPRHIGDVRVGNGVVTLYKRLP